MDYIDIVLEKKESSSREIEEMTIENVIVDMTRGGGGEEERRRGEGGKEN